jgi:ABC-type transport system involved in cytochrome bd biosynthesis fused ATPase/permease subunit
MGTFYSKEGGEAQLKRLSAEINFDIQNDTITFLDNIIVALKKDKRENLNEAERNIADQIKNIPEFYEYLFSLKFLENNYQLKQGDKNLEQLSPGERGALLLVFYLLLDRSDLPLIIDQPEDNLDNHSVATILVPFIKMAKRNRQIIMVTHNPNLAVVADAEQVIYVKLDKDKNYEFSTVTGSIENKLVNQKIVEVLEGAMPAFNTRKKKYHEN